MLDGQCWAESVGHHVVDAKCWADVETFKVLGSSYTLVDFSFSDGKCWALIIGWKVLGAQHLPLIVESVGQLKSKFSRDKLTYYC